MASIKLTGDTSGEITISAPAVAGTNTLTLPATTGTILDSNSTLSSSNLSGALPAIDGSALTGISGVVTASSIGTSDNSNGYILFDNTLLINWVRKSSTSTQTITFPLAFTNYYGVYHGTETAGGAYLRIHSLSTTSVTVGSGGANVTGWVLAFGRKT